MYTANSVSLILAKIDPKRDEQKRVALWKGGCTILYCPVWHSATLCCTILQFEVPYSNINCRIALYCTIFQCEVPYCIGLVGCTVLQCEVPYCTVLHCVAPYCTVLPCVTLSYTGLHYISPNCTVSYCARCDV